MAEIVGGIEYTLSIDTAKLIRGEREASRSLSRLGDEGDRLGGRLKAVASAISVYAIALQALNAAKAADDMRLLAARVEVAAGSMQLGAEAMKALQEISTRTQSSISANVDVFARLNQSMIQMGGTQQDTLQLTELLGKAIKVSGASAQESTAAMLQFGQALGSGKLAGDELRSLMETAPYLMRQLADGIGVPVGALKKLGEEGKLTSDVVVKALGKAADKIDQDFQKFPQTIASAMTVVEDAAKRASEKFDDMTGTSAVLAGAAKGLGSVLDKLAQQFGDNTSEADKLGRSTLVQRWAENTSVVLSYVVDAAEFVTRGFRQMGAGLGGLAAAAGAAANGELKQAKDILGMMADDIKAIGSAKFSGAKMREQFQFAKEFVGPQAPAGLGYTPSKLKPPAPEDDKKKPKKKPFDQVGYLADLRAKSASEFEKIGIDEAEELRKADGRLKAKEISEKTHAEAVALIRQAAAQQRRELSQKELDDLVQSIQAEERLKDEAERREQQRQDDITRARQGAMAAIADATEDPVLRIRLEEERKLAELAAWQAKDLENTQLYQDAKTAIETQAAKAREDAAYTALQNQVNSASSAFGSIADITRNFAGEQSGIYRAMFAVSKGFAIAESIVKIQQGIANAAALPFPANIPAMATVAASTANIVSTISGTNFVGGRQYGGPVSADKLYRVNERGAPEMYTSSTGKQYMLPTANGQVTAANRIEGGGSVQWNIVVNNTAMGTQASASVDQQSRTVQIAVTEVANQISSNSGPVWSAMRGSTNIRSAL